MLTPNQTLEASDAKLTTARKIDKKNNGEKNYEFTVNTIFLENVQLLRFQELQNIFLEIRIIHFEFLFYYMRYHPVVFWLW